VLIGPLPARSFGWLLGPRASLSGLDHRAEDSYNPSLVTLAPFLKFS
jgi:hypothetical protein